MIFLLASATSHAQIDSAVNCPPQEEYDPREEAYFPKSSEYIKRNLQYPEKARQAGVKGVVIVKFYVETDCSLTNFVIEKSLTPECDAEAIRILQNMPCWEPCKYDGVPERCAYMWTVKFPPEK